MFHLANKKLNAAGLAPEHSKALPERQPEEDEKAIMQALVELYTSQPSASSFDVFSPETIFTMPTGDVAVGVEGIRAKFADLWKATPHRQLRQRLLQTPDTLPLRTMVVDQDVAFYEEGQSEPVKVVNSLLVLKRRAQDGKVGSMTEEEAHKKATAPLAARAAAASNFYSPTDNMVSPCTSKLNLAKKKHHLKGKPMALFANQSGLRSSQTPGSADAEMGF